MTTAKELAFKAYSLDSKISIEELTARFEHWWSDNYGNRDTTKFNPEVSVFIEGRRYIQAE